jgi:uncharacterized protein involved in exopolysaccharide biosynthesis
MKYEALQQEQTVLTGYLQPVWQRKWLVLVVAVGVFGFFMWRTYSTEPRYEAVTTVQFTIPAESAVLDRVGAIVGGGPRGMESEIEILKSRVIAERTAIKLHKHYSVQPLSPEVVVEVTGVAVADPTRSRAAKLTFVDDLSRYEVSDPGGKFGTDFQVSGTALSG